MKSWHDIVLEVQSKPEYAELISNSYMSPDMLKNFNRFYLSEEYVETRRMIKSFGFDAGCKLLDVGCGNGVSALSFAKDGYNVTCVEPNVSNIVGVGAIRKLCGLLHENKVSILTCGAENMPLGNESYNVVYARQSLHHADDINKFCKEISRVLVKGGIFLTLRDHVIYNDDDKYKFLQNHPLHKYYGGENAYTLEEYKEAFILAGFKIVMSFGHYDTVINYYPLTRKQVKIIKIKYVLLSILEEVLPAVIMKRVCKKGSYKYKLDEKKIPGRLYTFLVQKI